MSRETRRSIESDLEELEADDEDEELTTVELWRMFLNGELPPDHPAEQAEAWHRAGEE